MAKHKHTRSAAPAHGLRAPTGAASASMTAHNAAANNVALANWNPFPGSADNDLLPELGTMMSRSRDLGRNNGLMAGGLQTLRDNVVGATLRLSATPDYRLLGWSREQAREWGNHTEAKFRTWFDTTECDAARTLNGLGMTLQAFGGSMLNGDAVALPLWLPRPGAAWNTRIQLVEADRLATPLELTHREDIRGGIKFDLHGAPLAYCILKHHPGDLLSVRASMQDYEMVPAYTAWGRRRVIHLHDKERTGQSRGRPVVSSVMAEFHMAGKYASNELQASLANSLVAAFLESDMDQTEVQQVFGKDLGDTWGDFMKKKPNVRQMEGAAILPLPPGAKLNSFSPGRPNPSFEAFMLASLRSIAAGMNMPYELLVKDFSKTNYSSARASLLEAWRYFNGRRRWLTDYWLRPLYELWLEEAVNAGQIEAPGFYENKYAYTRARFIFGGRGWVDPVKDANASQIRMNGNVSTLEQECAEQGLDYEEVLDQRALEKRMMAERGLSTADVQVPGSKAKQNNNPDEDPDADETDDEQEDEPTGDSRGRSDSTQKASA